MSFNFWLEDVINVNIAACARGEDWRHACEAVNANSNKPLRVLTRDDLKGKGCAIRASI